MSALLADVVVVAVIAVTVGSLLGLVACAVAWAAGSADRVEERADRFTRFDWQQRGWFQ